AEPVDQLFAVAYRHTVVRRRLPYRLRLHATLRYRHAERHKHSGRPVVERALYGSRMADRRGARHRSKFPDVSRDRTALDLRLVALPRESATQGVELTRETLQVHRQRCAGPDDAR